MSTELDRRLLQVIVTEAVAATRATQGWLLVVDDAGATVVAASDGLAGRTGEVVPVEGARGFALAAGQASALLPGPADTTNAGVAGWDGIPPSLLVAPGGDGRVLVEVAGKVGGGGFAFEDIEALESLAAIGAAAVEERHDADDVPPPARLGAELAALAAADARRYRDVARMLETLLAAAR
ncbi:MAG TPA: hypothetical protein VK866_01920 [Acidimicrobiales bacterium]|nr:hypothetical protein [Acidimicrobiales bacterium]